MKSDWPDKSPLSQPFFSPAPFCAMVVDTYESVRPKCQVGGSFSFPIKGILDNKRAYCQAIEALDARFGRYWSIMVDAGRYIVTQEQVCRLKGAAASGRRAAASKHRDPTVDMVAIVVDHPTMVAMATGTASNLKELIPSRFQLPKKIKPFNIPYVNFHCRSPDRLLE